MEPGYKIEQSIWSLDPSAQRDFKGLIMDNYHGINQVSIFCDGPGMATRHTVAIFRLREPKPKPCKPLQ